MNHLNQLISRFEQILPSTKSRMALTGFGALGFYAAVKNFWPANYSSPIGKAVLVTGCDTPLGFGHGIARKLRELGYVVFAACLNVNVARQTLYCDMKDDNNFQVIQMDVTKHDEIESAFKFVSNWLQSNKPFRLYGVINNAGIGMFTPLEWVNMESFINVFDVNCFGIVRVTKAFLPLIRNTGHDGRVIVIASLAGEVPNPGATSYCGSKAAAIAVADCLALEVRKFGISVSCICPDFYRTNIITDADKQLAVVEKEASFVSPEVFEAYGGNERLRRLKQGSLEILPKIAKTDISPVINCVIDALANSRPAARYRPIDFKHQIGLFFYKHTPFRSHL